MYNKDIVNKRNEENSSDGKSPLVDMKTIHESVIKPHGRNHSEQPTVSAYIDPKTGELIKTDYDE